MRGLIAPPNLSPRTSHLISGNIMIVLILIYLLLSLVMGLLGRNRKFGFWGYFFGSIVLTPLIGLLLVLASDSRKADHKENEE